MTTANDLRETFVRFLFEALLELRAAVRELMQETTPETPLPRARSFVFYPGVRWPGGPKGNWVNYIRVESSDYEVGRNWDSELQALAKRLVERCGYQPRKVLRVQRRIMAAAAWCRARAEGRRRMAQEILRQQARALETIENERAMQALGKL
jgi:hypothetical protein